MREEHTILVRGDGRTESKVFKGPVLLEGLKRSIVNKTGNIGAIKLCTG